MNKNCLAQRHVEGGGGGGGGGGRGGLVSPQYYAPLTAQILIATYRCISLSYYKHNGKTTVIFTHALLSNTSPNLVSRILDPTTPCPPPPPPPPKKQDITPVLIFATVIQ